MNEKKLNDVPLLLWTIFPPSLYVFILIVSRFNYSLYREFVTLDGSGFTLVEHSTVAILIPGILFGFFTLLKHRKKLPNRFVATWIGLWTLALFYFAGEEISWGQWIFRWESPELFLEHNNQGETNLHNMNRWFDKFSQNVVIWTVISGCLFWPIFRKRFNIADWPTSDWRYWISPTVICTVAAAFLFLIRMMRALEIRELDPYCEREIMEYYVAVSLTFYLGSIWYRLKQINK